MKNMKRRLLIPTILGYALVCGLTGAFAQGPRVSVTNSPGGAEIRPAPNPPTNCCCTGLVLTVSMPEKDICKDSWKQLNVKLEKKGCEAGACAAGYEVQLMSSAENVMLSPPFLNMEANGTEHAVQVYGVNGSFLKDVDTITATLAANECTNTASQIYNVIALTDFAVDCGDCSRKPRPDGLEIPYKVSPGRTGVARSDIRPEDWGVNWSFLKFKEGSATVGYNTLSYTNDITLMVEENNKLNIVIDKKCPPCKFWVRCAAVNITPCGTACGPVDRLIEVGCACAGDSGGGNQCAHCLDLGGLSLKQHSVDAEFSMGTASNGNHAGSLYIIAETMTTSLAAPAALRDATRPHEVEVIKIGSAVRQAKSAQGLADVVALDNFKYEIRYYLTDQIGGMTTGGVYSLSGAPFVKYLVENPYASTNQYDKLRISRIIDAETNVSEFAWIQASGTWTLSRGNGLSAETQVETYDVPSSSRLVTDTTVDISGNPVLVNQYVYRTGGDGKERLAASVVSPGDIALTSSFTYYENPAESGKYGNLKLQVAPDGSWIRYDYSAAGLNTLVVSGFKDADTNATAEQARSVEFSYDNAPVGSSGDDGTVKPTLPRVITEKVLGRIVSKTFHAYVAGPNAEITEIIERCAATNAAYGDAGNLRSVSTYYGDNVAACAVYRLKTSVQPDGRQASYSYEFGDYTSSTNPALCSFTPNASGTYIRTTVTEGLTNAVDGIAGKTTRSVSVQDRLGYGVLDETYVYSGTGYERIAWTVSYLDSRWRETSRHNSDGTYTETTWACCGKESEVAGDGIQQSFLYDNLSRLNQAIKEGVGSVDGYPAQGLTWVDYVLDAAGRQLAVTNNGGSIALANYTWYDSAGRTTQTVDQAGLKTTYQYFGNGLTNVTILPGGLTNETASYLDGRTKYTKVNDVIQSWQDHGVNDDGTQWSITYTGPLGASSPMWSKTTTDVLGRSLREERPGFGSGVILTNAFFYNDKGQLVKTTRTGAPDTLYEYNELGEQVRSGLDMNANSALDLGSVDRVSGSTNYFEKIGSDWWSVSASTIYASESSATPITNSIQKTQLTGLSASMTAKSVSRDILGNETVATTAIDSDNKKTTQTVIYPDSTNNAVTVSVNGLTQKSVSKTGVDTRFSYDAIGRQVRSETTGGPQSLAAVTHYSERGQVDWIEDAASNRTSFAYDPDTGRQIAVTNAVGQAVYTAYDSQGRAVGTWGATYPVAYDFDDYNRMVAMYTYRGTNALSTYADLLAVKSSMDKTTWLFDPATGIMTNKLYADLTGPRYDYTSDGKLAKRTWARGIDTTYSYSLAGELQAVDYAGSVTPHVTNRFDRLGRITNVIDGAGSRYFKYSPTTFALTNETLGSTVITRAQDSLGRSSGLSFPNPENPVDPVYSVQYSYSTIGRFAGLTSVVGGQSNTWNYSYVPNSDLIAGWSNGIVSTVKSYESNRSLLTQVKNMGTNLISQFDYVNDQLGRRTQRIDAGSAVATNAFGYNTRSELSSASMGTNQFGYVYDPIGNRTSATNNGAATDYQANLLNQYTNITTGAVQAKPTFDLDGNMTSNGVFTFAWDAENRLISVSSNGNTVLTCNYDYMSRRFQKTAGATTSTFVWDGWLLVSELSNSTTNYYVSGLDLSQSFQGAGGIGGLLSVTRNGVTYYPVCDGNGNITEYADASATVVAHREFDAYGNTMVASGAMANSLSFWFSSKYLDPETGFYYYGSRYYDSVSGRWTNRDRIEEDEGLNLYTFCINDGITFVDKMGEMVFVQSLPEKPPSPSSGYYNTIGTASITGFGVCNWKPGKIGVAIEITWQPPDNWKGKPDDCECNAVAWYQVVHKYDLKGWRLLKPTHLLFGLPAIDFGPRNYTVYSDTWAVDGSTGPIGRSLPGSVRSKASSMHDIPEVPVGGWISAHATAVSMRAESCAMCLGGNMKGRILGCIQWGWDWPDKSGGVAMLPSPKSAAVFTGPTDAFGRLLREAELAESLPAWVVLASSTR
ncbi:MAG: hypothetical protein C0404_04490 [Verrucomicrobia bacterium]|nr:hypothetical protein [Verrucomicrobiota bacterium]